jgi:hypothetical protein
MQTPPLMARLLHPSWLHHFLWSPPQMHPSWLQQRLTSFAPCVTKTPPLMTCWCIRRDCTVSLIALCVMHAPPNWILLEHPSKLKAAIFHLHFSARIFYLLLHEWYKLLPIRLGVGTSLEVASLRLFAFLDTRLRLYDDWLFLHCMYLFTPIVLRGELIEIWHLCNCS